VDAAKEDDMCLYSWAWRPAGIGRPCLRFVVPPQLLGTLAGQTASRFRSTAARAGVDVAWIDPAAEAFPGPLEVTAMASVFDDER